jgi:hypothetical protein
VTELKYIAKQESEMVYEALDCAALFRLMSSRSAERYTLNFSGIPKGTTQDDLQAVFEKYNPVEIRIMREDSDGSRGFAFVRFDSEKLNFLVPAELLADGLLTRYSILPIGFSQSLCG